jgi:uncharacterized protein (TIGR02808 family)
MSAVEILLWNVLGYSTIAVVFIVGFAVTAVVACFLLERFGLGGEH